MLTTEEMMYRSIMVPFSDWQSDRSALELAVSIASRSAARLHIVHIRRGRRSTAALAAEDRALDAAVDWAISELDESVSFRMIPNDRPGIAAHEIAADLRGYARDNTIDLIVMSHRRHSVNRLLFGSVAEQLVNSTKSAFLFVPAGAENIADRGCKFLVPVDESDSSDRTAHEAGMLARLVGGSVILVGVNPPFEPPHGTEFMDLESAERASLHERKTDAFLAGVTRELRAEGTSTESMVLIGDRVNMIRRAARTLHMDVISVPMGDSGLAETAAEATHGMFKPFDSVIFCAGRPMAVHVEDSDAAGLRLHET
jgi:nucleotide-binding universal stress UspA family protein